MARKPAAPPPSSGPSESEPHTEHVERPGRRERFGPVSIARHVKDDGRALILYGHVECGQAGEPA
jgi:hypothetical protein